MLSLQKYNSVWRDPKSWLEYTTTQHTRAGRNTQPTSNWENCIQRNARPNNNQLITYYLPVCYLLRIQQYPVNTTYNIKMKQCCVNLRYLSFELKAVCRLEKPEKGRNRTKAQLSTHLVVNSNQKFLPFLLIKSHSKCLMDCYATH